MTDETAVPTPHPEDRLHQAIRDALNPTVSGLGELRQTLAAELDLDIEDVRVHGYIPGRETRHGYDARLRIEVLNGTAARPVSQGTEDELPDGFSPKDFAVAVGALIRDAQEAILVDMLGGLDPNDEWRRMARNAAKAAVKIAVQRGWRPVQ